MKNLRLEIASGDALDVRHFSVQEQLSALFLVSIVAVSENPSIDFDAVVGQPARFAMQAGLHQRFWSGLCNHFELLRAEPTGLSTYRFSIVPTMWLLTQRKNYRMFQHISEPDIAVKLLSEWGIEPERKIDAGAYKKRKYRVQYAESDFAFVNRMLEEAGITYHFAQKSEETRLVLSDAPQSNARRDAPLTFLDDASMVQRVDIEFATSVQMHQQVRPGKYAMRDHDYRKPPTYKLMSMASKGLAVEEKLERYEYTPGAFLFGTDSGEKTPSADDRGKTHTDEKEAAVLAQKRLDAKRGKGWVCSFETNAYDLAPGVVLSFLGHPHAALGDGKALLVVEASLTGTAQGEWSLRCEARKADLPFRPAQSTPKPKVNGVESATVVGPAGEEIHTDEFGRVRVHFHWDRESKMDEGSSCWIHVSQPWGGAGYGASNLPRIGQEVLVDFLGGDPDRPVIVGRVYTNLQKTPYKLPDNKTQSGWKSQSSPAGGPSNYNEIMFEDKKGQELVRMQAEKDLNKLVKHDEQVAIGNDRTKQVGHDDGLTVGHDRTRQVGHDETVQIGNDRTRFVGNNESVTVGSNRTKIVGQNESTTVGVNQNMTVGAAQSLKVGATQTVTVGGAQAVTVTLAAAETVGLAKALTVGAGYQVTVGGAMNTTVGLVQAEEVGLTKTVTVGQKIEFTCGAAKLVLEKSGKVTLEGTEFVFKSSGPVGVTGQKVTVGGTELGLSASGKAELAGGTVQITGDPIDLN
jgi:type VI secretion system secreted protein VgrG